MLHRSLVLAALVGLTGIAGCAASAARLPAATLPSAPVATVGGPQVNLAEMARGRPLVIELFATWCTSCRKGVPVLASLPGRYPRSDLVVAAIGVGEDAATATRFVERLGASCPVFGDPDFRFADQLGVTGIPALLVFDRTGRLVHAGRTFDDDAARAVDALIRNHSISAGER